MGAAAGRVAYNGRMKETGMTRRQALGLAGSVMAGWSKTAPAGTVAIARCSAYDGENVDTLKRLTDQCGGLGSVDQRKDRRAEVEPHGESGAISGEGASALPERSEHGAGALPVDGSSGGKTDPGDREFLRRGRNRSCGRGTGWM